MPIRNFKTAMVGLQGTDRSRDAYLAPYADRKTDNEYVIDFVCPPNMHARGKAVAGMSLMLPCGSGI